MNMMKAALRRVRARQFRVVAIGLPLVLAGLFLGACGKQPAGTATGVNDPHLATNGTVEVTAKLIEIPDGAIFKSDLYNYATVLKYKVLKVYRGKVDGSIIYMGQYDPWKPRAEAADRQVPDIGGNLRQFQVGQTQHLALDVPIENRFMGGIVNKYFGQTTNTTIYWAVWTDLE